MWPGYAGALLEHSRKPIVAVLQGFAFPSDDIRVTGTKGGRPRTSYCTSMAEARDCRALYWAQGYRGVRIVDHNKLRVKAKK